MISATLVHRSWSARRASCCAKRWRVNTLADLPDIPLRAGTLPVPELIDLYMAHYAGRDPTRVQRLSWWRAQLVGLALQDVSDDHVHAALEALAQQPPRYWAGTDADGRAIYKAKRKAIAPATVNRYCASIGAVFTWAIKRRIAPKGSLTRFEGASALGNSACALWSLPK